MLDPTAPSVPAPAPTPADPGRPDEAPYALARDYVRDGDILLFRGRRLLSYVICWATRSRYSHAGIAAWWGSRLMVMQADTPLVAAIPLSACVNDYVGGVELWTVDAPFDRAKVVEAAKESLGKRFAIWAMVKVLRRIAGLVRKGWESDPADAPSEFFCAQFVSYAYRKGGLDLAKDVPDHLTEPEDIARALHMRMVSVLKP